MPARACALSCLVLARGHTVSLSRHMLSQAARMQSRADSLLAPRKPARKTHSKRKHVLSRADPRTPADADAGTGTASRLTTSSQSYLVRVGVLKGPTLLRLAQDLMLVHLDDVGRFEVLHVVVRLHLSPRMRFITTSARANERAHAARALSTSLDERLIHEIAGNMEQLQLQLQLLVLLLLLSLRHLLVELAGADGRNEAGVTDGHTDACLGL